VHFFGNLVLIIFTISAFYFGETLQARTTSTFSAEAKNNSLILASLSIATREAPPTTMACLPLVVSTLFRVYLSMLVSYSGSVSYIRCYYIILSSKPAEYPMLTAVSILSPVNTQTLIPAALINYIVSATSSCNLSSIAVAPISSKSVSISSSTAATISSLFLISNLAALAFLFHSS
jgi:hypothetical protein